MRGKSCRQIADAIVIRHHSLDHPGLEFPGLVHCYPTLDRSGLEFSAWPGSGRLVAPVGFASMIAG